MKVSSVVGYSVNENFKGKKQKAQAPETKALSTPQTSEIQQAKPEPDYYNPVSVKKEKALAVLSSTGIAAGVGVALGAGIKLLTNASKKVAALAGAGAALATLALALPGQIYNTNVKATVKKKEMDVFTADKELQKDLTKDVHKEVLDPDVPLEQKLNDNIKLHLAKSAALVNFPL